MIKIKYYDNLGLIKINAYSWCSTIYKLCKKYVDSWCCTVCKQCKKLINGAQHIYD